MYRSQNLARLGEEALKMLGMEGRERNIVNCILTGGGGGSTAAVILEAEIHSTFFWLE